MQTPLTTFITGRGPKSSRSRLHRITALAVVITRVVRREKPSPLMGEGLGGGGCGPARRRSSHARRRDFPGPRCSKTAECDSLGFPGTHFARPPPATSDRVGRRRFPRSSGPRGTQNRQCSGRSAPGGGTCTPLFDASAFFARAVFPPRSCSAVKCELAHVCRRRDAS